MEVLSKFAQLEYKMGEPERGKTMFENILSSYPKRTDLWSVYIDMTIKLADLSDVRYDYVEIPSLCFFEADVFLVFFSTSRAERVFTSALGFKVCT